MELIKWNATEITILLGIMLLVGTFPIPNKIA